MDSPTTPEAVPQTTPKHSTKPAWILLAIILILGSGIGGFFLGKQWPKPVELTAFVSTPTITTDPTGDWKSYSNTQYGYSLKHPKSWEEIVDPNSYGKEFTLQSPNKELIHVIVFDGVADTKNDNDYTKTFSLTSNNHILVTYVECDGPSCNFGKLNLPTFSQILSTFKFSDQAIISTPTNKPNSYVAPSNWTKSSLMQKSLTICLPPKWESDLDANVYFNRDANYRPLVAYVQNIPYTSGSTREAYLKFWEGEYPDVRTMVTFQEIVIGNNSALAVYPSESREPKYSPDGLAVVWYAGGKLWKAGISNWASVNTSQTAFLKDFYTMIACSF